MDRKPSAAKASRRDTLHAAARFSQLHELPFSFERSLQHLLGWTWAILLWCSHCGKREQNQDHAKAVRMQHSGHPRWPSRLKSLNDRQARRPDMPHLPHIPRGPLRDRLWSFDVGLRFLGLQDSQSAKARHCHRAGMDGTGALATEALDLKP